MKPIILILLLLHATIQCGGAAKILFFWGMGGYSHRITVWPLVEKLADNGHRITFFSSHAPKKPTTHPNITELTPDNLYARINMNYDPGEIRIRDGVAGTEKLWPSYAESGMLVCDAIAKDESLRKWSDTETYDLVVVNALFNDCGYGLAHKFGARTIAYSTSSIFPWWGEIYGFPEENYPEFQYHLPSNMTFFQQVWNTFTPLYWLMLRRWSYLPKVEEILRTQLNVTGMPPLEEMDQRNELLLINSHFSEEFPRSLPPWAVPVGGMHCTDRVNPLPKDLKNFVESWDDGFVYFSFGTYMKLPLLPQAHQDAILGAIRKFPSVGFVVKWNGGDPPKNRPKNMFPGEWLPQQDILGHPNIRAFITHGGLLSTEEAMYFGVPLIVFPFFAEQDFNAERIQSRERGLAMEIREMTQDKLENAIRAILTDEKFKRNMEHASRIFRDRPENPADTAAWWVGYVLRHGDTSHLKPIGIRRTWYERRMLHIWAFVAFTILAAGVITAVLIKKMVTLLFNTLTNRPSFKIKSH